jgi:uncharacterized protein YjiK
MKKTKTSIIRIAVSLSFFLFLNIISCSNSSDKSGPSTDIKKDNFIGYNLSDPDETIILPSVLHEISGITVIDSSSVACVQDESGIVFIYDIKKNEIRNHIFFHGNGDYEGITRVDNIIYVLRSNGVLYEIKNLKSSDVAREILLNKLSDNDNEGLCYDRNNNRLLIAPKDKPEKNSEDKDIRVIYGFDLKRGELIKNPVISFDLSKINKFASDNKVFPEAESKKKDKDNKPDIKFRPSDLGIHPLTGKLFVLSADEHLLYIFHINGTIENIIRLNRKIFNMPEGITFFNNGDMLISNEGKNNMPTLLRFNYKPD